MKLILRGRCHDLSSPVLMGIINVTPDSFSGDGLRQNDIADPVAAALEHAEIMLSAGATILDLGAVSTRPGATPVDEATEEERLWKPFSAIREAFPDALISIDTTSSQIAAYYLERHADIVNSVAPTLDPRLAEAVKTYGGGLVLMHGRQRHRCETDIIREISERWKEMIEEAHTYGISDQQLLLDPGIGFGKDSVQNLEIIRRLDELCDVFDYPVMVGASRKQFIGLATGHHVAADRDPATAAITALSAQAGAKIIRVHNVAMNRDALAMAAAINQT